MQRILRNRKATIGAVSFYDDDETALVGTGVTVTITRADGSVLQAATAAAGTTAFTFQLPAQADLNLLTAVWSGTFDGVTQSQTTTVEIVGGHYLSLAAIRGLTNMEHHGKFSTEDLRAARDWFETAFEDYTGVAWVPRFARERVSGSGRSSLILPHRPVRSVLSVRTYTDAETYTTYTASELADIATGSIGVVKRVSLGVFAYGSDNLVVEYEHGYDSPPPDVVTAAKYAIRERLIKGYVGNRQYAVQTQEGIVRESTPGEDRPFGIFEADEIANRRRAERTPVCA